MLPMNGDRVDRQRVEAVEVGVRGRDAVWDMSRAIVVEDGCTMRFFNSGDSVVARIEGKRQHVYEIKGDSVLLRTYETALTNFADSLPALKMIFPLSYGDSITSPVYYRGKYSGNNAIASAGTYTMVVDGEGTLILPDDTVRNVLRIHERFDERVLVSPWIKPQVISADNDSLLRHVRDIYSWYSSDFRYPLVQLNQECFYSGANMTREDETAYLCTPDVQLYALGDVRQQRQMQSRSLNGPSGSYGYTANGNQNGSDNADQMFSDMVNGIGIIVNEGSVRVTTTLDGGSNAEVVLSDLHGRVFGSSRGCQVHTIDTSRLPYGTYLLHATDGENVRNERINIK